MGVSGKLLSCAAVAIAVASCAKPSGDGAVPAASVSPPTSAAVSSSVPAAPSATAPTGFDDSLFAGAAGGTIVGQILDGAGKPVRGAVAYVKSGVPDSAKFHAPAEPLVVDQRDKAFQPGVLPVLVGTTVDFRNDDPVMHNVYSRSTAKTFDLGTYSNKDKKATTFDTPGRVDIFCAIHTNMHAVVLVLKNPYFATTDARGHFEIQGVPAGPYSVAVWTDVAKEQEIAVDVSANGPAIVKATLPK
jgi:plastocyanin